MICYSVGCFFCFCYRHDVLAGAVVHSRPPAALALSASAGSVVHLRPPPLPSMLQFCHDVLTGAVVHPRPLAALPIVAFVF